jgi:hypothetical protein
MTGSVPREILGQVRKLAHLPVDGGDRATRHAAFGRNARRIARSAAA